MNTEPDTKYITELVFQLLMKCQQKEVRYAKKYDIPVAQFRCLRYVYLNPGITVKEIANYMNLSASRLTRIIDKLKERKLVERTEMENDRRFFNVNLTAQGKKLANELYTCYIKLHEDIFATIPKSKFKTITASLENILDAVNQWLETN